MESELTVFRDDELLQIAEAAEKRIDAVIKIKQVALKVTNARDWVNQDGNPYLMVSGSEKVANLFNISWRFLQPEPLCETEEDGHFTYTYQAEFSMGGRSIQIEGSRSSKDGFFKQYSWDKGVKSEKDVLDRDNRRDVKMAALTNLLGNGITRLLGIRNLTWEDLEKFAGIDRTKVKGFEYKKEGGGKPGVDPPQRKSTAKEEPIDADLKKKLTAALAELIELRGLTAAEILTEHSKFTDKENKDHSCDNLDDLFKSKKWPGAVYRKITDEIAEIKKVRGATEQPERQDELFPGPFAD